jgi:O-antigen/teichoic acid export membrane protein
MAAGGDANSKGPFVASLFRQITWMTMLPFFLVGIGGDRIFGLVFGENWLEAGVYCQILSFSLFINFI